MRKKKPENLNGVRVFVIMFYTGNPVIYSSSLPFSRLRASSTVSPSRVRN